MVGYENGFALNTPLSSYRASTIVDTVIPIPTADERVERENTRRTRHSTRNAVALRIYFLLSLTAFIKLPNSLPIVPISTEQ